MRNLVKNTLVKSGAVAILMLLDFHSVLAVPKPVKVTKPAPIVPSGYELRFFNPGQNNGVDTHDPLHVWMAVPVGGTNHVTAQNVGDDSNVNPANLKWATDDKVLTVTATKTNKFEADVVGTGIKKDDTSVSAMGKVGTVVKAVGKLDVSVLQSKTYTVNLLFMKDGNGNHTSRSISSAQSIINQLNLTYNKQANIHFTLNSAQEATFMTPGNPSPTPSHLPDLIKIDDWFTFMTVAAIISPSSGDPYEPADLNILLVWGVDIDPNSTELKNEALGEAKVHGNISVIGEYHTGDGCVFPHEIGHNLGLPHISEDTNQLQEYGDNLMFPVNRGQFNLRRAQILLINPTKTNP